MPVVRRDWMNLDPATGLPYCYGHEDPALNVCLICDLQIACRETQKMGAGTPVLIFDDEKAIEEAIRAAAEIEESEEEDDEEPG